MSTSQAKHNLARGAARRLVLLVTMVLSALVATHLWGGGDARAFFGNSQQAHEPLVRHVVEVISADVRAEDFDTGGARFNGEWAFGTHQMATLGLLQFVTMHPATRDEYLPVVDASIDAMTRPEMRRFDTAAWGEDALETLDGDNDHAAYLGYLNLVLGLRALVAPDSANLELNRRITEKLVRRMTVSEHHLLESYPYEAYPVDNTAVLASVKIYDRVSGEDHSSLLQTWRDAWEERYVDPNSGLLVQAVAPRTGVARDAPRASGTALGAYFLSFADEEWSARLFTAIKTCCASRWLGLTVVREYPPSVSGWGDVDSGPVIFGASVSGTGFTLALSRIHRDQDLFTGVYRTAHLVGAPVSWGGEQSFVTGGPLGNAIMLAMLTAGEAP